MYVETYPISGFLNIKFISRVDILSTGNPALTDDSAKYLTCYKKLEHVDLSGTGFQVKINVQITTSQTFSNGLYGKT